jgi:hypothetical protein
VDQLLGGGLWSMVDHGQGRQPRLVRELTARHYTARNLVVVVRESGAGHDGPHCALWWPAQWRGEAGGEEEKTMTLELGVGRLGARRSEIRSGTRCGVVLRYEGGLL